MKKFLININKKSFLKIRKLFKNKIIIKIITFKIKYGGDLLSHTVASAVPSALKVLTSVFEMGTGVSPSQ